MSSDEVWCEECGTGWDETGRMECRNPDHETVCCVECGSCLHGSHAGDRRAVWLS